MLDLARYYKKPADIEGKFHYDASRHRWEIAPEYIQSVNPALQYKDALRKSHSYSAHIYEFLFHFIVASFNRQFAEWLLNCTEEGQSAMFEALEEQCQADAQSSIDDIAYQAPLSEKGKDHDPMAMIKSSVAPFAQQMLDDFNLNGIYINKKFYLGVTLGADRYERWEY
jgi:hypothetical protein